MTTKLIRGEMSGSMLPPSSMSLSENLESPNSGSDSASSSYSGPLVSGFWTEDSLEALRMGVFERASDEKHQITCWTGRNVDGSEKD